MTKKQSPKTNAAGQNVHPETQKGGTKKGAPSSGASRQQPNKSDGRNAKDQDGNESQRKP